MLSNQQVTDEMLRYLRSTNDPMLNAAADALSKLAEVERERDAMRQQGQDEGFAAAVCWLRDRSAMKPPAALWHAASLLADQLEQSRIPCAAKEQQP